MHNPHPMNEMKYYNLSDLYNMGPGFQGHHIVYIHFADGNVKVKETQLIYDHNSLVGEMGGLLFLSTLRHSV